MEFTTNKPPADSCWQLANRQATVCATSTTGLTFQAPAMPAAGAAPVTALCAYPQEVQPTWT